VIKFVSDLQQVGGFPGGPTYVRWGRKDCPLNNTELVYTGKTLTIIPGLWLWYLTPLSTNKHGYSPVGMWQFSI
jgi:hypothetical protein